MHIYANTQSNKRLPLWIFAAQPRDVRETQITKFHVEAESEQEARRLLAPTHICFFAGCIRH
ncbi:host cell division inhibitor Icd-like protein (plasmid) [Raoultella ornithinolytica]|uniref:host cell division inhibitor Icd-like protein n=1 Tax=Raoultella ornithinolytica TaxID=54291 RepID=UPI00292BA4D4|nr:host cell division inhibitor Icd-like protein [Raoultella ornithinolytica]MDV1094990.1 host cell division inhibitor Icd-like protein [Raoultella ornithinolytica]MDV1122666.1 host cell division inhibitor Icd-like protein [Raoultella ornithinolytica]MDV1893181.1 host cell division inhibitor Icd-like protein [Raoultella ornithinolytica]